MKHTQGIEVPLPLIDPLDVLQSNIVHQMLLFENDRDLKRVDEIKRMSIKCLEIEHSFRVILN